MIKKSNFKLLFYSAFITYLVWAAYWIGICQHPIAEECISARWALMLTGLPSTILTMSLGGVGVEELILVAAIGALQWALIVVFIVKKINGRSE